MNSFSRCVAAVVVVFPSTCCGQLFWGFEDNTEIPPGWTETDIEGTWAISPSLIDPNYPSGNVLSASLYRPPDPTSGQGGDGDNAVEIYTPEFRFQNFATALLDFDLNINPAGCLPSGCLDAIQVWLVSVATPAEHLLMHYYRNDPVTNELPIDVSEAAPSAVTVNDETLYRVRLRVFDGDLNPSVFEVDNLSLTSAYLTADYNQNGGVDASDYVVWRKTLGSAGPANADGNGNGAVDANDYLKWSDSFGTFAVSGASASAVAGTSVPEPHWIDSLAVLIIGLAMNPDASRWFLRHENRRRGRLASVYRDR